MSFLYLFLCSACLSPLKRLHNPYLHASRQTCLQTTNFPQFNPENNSYNDTKRAIQGLKQDSLFSHKHRLPLYQVYRLAHRSQHVESTPFAHDGNRFGIVTSTVLSTLLETKLRFLVSLWVQTHTHTDVTTATRAARLPGERTA